MSIQVQTFRGFIQMASCGLVRLLLGGIILLQSACSISRYVPEGERVYVGSKVIMTPDSLARPQVRGLQPLLDELIRPVPNSTLLGFPYKVWFHYTIGTPKRPKGIRAWFRKRLAEPPVFISQRAVTTNTEVLRSYLNNEGFFASEVAGQIIETKNSTALAQYTTKIKPRYFIRNLTFEAADSSQFMLDFLSTKSGSLLQEGRPYQLGMISQERARIDRQLKQKGYYFFSPDHILMEVDSSLGNHQVDISVIVKPNVSQIARRPYQIRNVNLYINGTPSDTLPLAPLREGLRIYDFQQNYKPHIFTDAIGFRPGALYQNALHEVSLARLINLRNFKFVRSQYELIPRSDSALLDLNYYLTSVRKKALRAELSAVTKSNNLAGTQANLSWNNRNLFRGAEQFRVSASTGLDFQVGGGSRSIGNDFTRIFANSELTFPRFILPFYHYDPAVSQGLPKTTLSIAYESLTQRGLYSLNSYRGQWGYLWSRSTEVEHSLIPFSFNIVRPGNITEEFVNRLFTSPNFQDQLRYIRILENRLILESIYTISYRPVPKAGSRHQWALSGGINVAGNLANLFAKRNQESGTKDILGIQFEQFARFDAEARYYVQLSPSLRWANRFIGGLGIAYGNSILLPPFKQYFAGGSTGIRAFRARTLGPGAYYADSITRSIFGNSSFGDIKLELNTELRYKLTNFIETAAFIDAGNVWTYRFSEDYGEGAVFSKNFMKQVALGAGLGLRLDFTYLIFRLDLATPLRKPWYTNLENPRSPWVFDEWNPRNKAWRQENLILNIAVAYPF